MGPAQLTAQLCLHCSCQPLLALLGPSHLLGRILPKGRALCTAGPARPAQVGSAGKAGCLTASPSGSLLWAAIAPLPCLAAWQPRAPAQSLHTDPWGGGGKGLLVVKMQEHSALCRGKQVFEPQVQWGGPVPWH
ncbi:hypothetical protein KIL84_021676 [Mauremys mutica]|uniref:Uncharacterized protein n=1 Tax=Mauremys mutica TaxID=74926 RepID=A0A9D3X989_9SAUR|nr:hypothetical protein KIL84_021676 [Mauremys mutica]